MRYSVTHFSTLGMVGVDFFKLYFKAPKAEKQLKKLNSASGHFSGIFRL